jgi:zinc D-Ala-D-Ala carboxypeptidase
MTQLTQHFSLEEFTHSQTASRLGIDNDLPIALKAAAIRTCQGLEQVRIVLNANAIHISSGYRCKALNDAVGSKDSSQHMKAEAVDFTSPFATPRRIVETIIDSDIDYDQIILEFDSWVHISFAERNRFQALIIDKFGTRGFK